MRSIGKFASMHKRFAWLVGLWLALGAVAMPASIINGQKYVSIADWAKTSGFKASWVKWGDKLLVTGAGTRLLFDVDSHDADINGVDVRLSFPVAKGAFIAQFDLDKTVRPLLWPSRYVADDKVKTICLDPGHGGKDTGNRVGWRNEKTYTLQLAIELAKQLTQAGFKVILTRKTDTYVELPDRPALANRAKADLFVSLHFNATTSGKADVSGPETYCITPVGAASSNAQGEGSNYGSTTANRQEKNSLLLAYEVQKFLSDGLKANDRGVRRARFAVLRDATMPAILIEGGYMTHPVEGKKIFSDDYRRQMAAQIVKGIQAYQQVTAPPASKPIARPKTATSVKRTTKSKSTD